MTLSEVQASRPPPRAAAGGCRDGFITWRSLRGRSIHDQWGLRSRKREASRLGRGGRAETPPATSESGRKVRGGETKMAGRTHV